MLTPRGAILLGASLALIVLGFLRTDGILITLGASSCILLAGAWGFVRLNLRRLSLSLRAPTRIYADHPFDLRVILHDNRSLLDAFSIKIHLRLAGQVDIHTFAPWTAARSISEVRLRGSIPGRSSLLEHDYTLETNMPLGLFHMKASGIIRHEILVFPRPLTPNELSTRGALHDASLLPGTTPGQAPGDLRGIRQPCMPLAQFGSVEAQAVHAGIQLQPDIQRARQLTAQQSLDLRRALQKAVKQLHGAYALALVFQGENDLIVAARRGSPLAIGYGEGEGGQRPVTTKAQRHKELHDEVSQSTFAIF